MEAILERWNIGRMILNGFYSYHKIVARFYTRPHYSIIPVVPSIIPLGVIVQSAQQLILAITI